MFGFKLVERALTGLEDLLHLIIHCILEILQFNILLCCKPDLVYSLHLRHMVDDRLSDRGVVLVFVVLQPGIEVIDNRHLRALRCGRRTV